MLALPLGYCVAQASLAKSKAEAICSAIEPNASFSEAEAIVARAGIAKHAHPKFLDEDFVSAPPDHMMIVIPSSLFERWICGVQFAHGRVVKKAVALDD